MDIEKYTKVSHKKYGEILNNNISDKKIRYLKNLITRFLLSIILVLITSILIKVDDNNVLLIDKYIFKDSIEFTKINNWYKDNIGSIIPNNANNASMVFSSDELKKNKYEEYLDGVKINIDKSSPISLLMGGIVVFNGEKAGYGHTLILQGNDGIDYWYGGLTNLNVNLYDYIEKDTLIGEAENNYLYLVLEKDGKYLNYDEYIT